MAPLRRSDIDLVREIRAFDQWLSDKIERKRVELEKVSRDRLEFLDTEIYQLEVAQMEFRNRLRAWLFHSV